MAALRDTSAINSVTGAVSTCDTSITVASNSDRLLVAIATTDTDTDVDISSVAFTTQGGAANTDAFTYFNFGSGNLRRQEVWYFLAPATGSATVRATFASAVGGSLALYSLYNADQTTPLDGFVSGTTGLTFNVSSATGDFCIAQFIGNGSVPTFTSGTGDVSASLNQTNPACGYSDGAATVTFTVTTGTNIRGSVGFNVNAAAASGIVIPIRMAQTRMRTN